ncbi:NAD-dependent epimerase/dehydratase [Thioalkalivibrio nitratireducens DSM 14787]|uniref:NAD-dependent epimerase/dehydratase n=1 Tax=Thioalkalivibrio nitratireducens (strain DSM 14787 / UNIQEM 213 / ALEN2) TaxID=1255043 RepID=L0DYM0_THIND|nr:complex I NDUFA9 subunit family protein [Thioalkalivibrio nitratireducens]AGA34694.1 NAD-dependent epimerase/dehydratase [Thioalkalivibrio nitratireducens DSM 14787]
MTPDITTVFGGTGFLGSRIVREIVASGRPVRIAARHPVRPAWAGAGDAIELATANIHDETSVARALDGATAAVNAVSLYAEAGGHDTFEAVHVTGAGRMARLAREAGVRRLVHISGIGADVTSPSFYVRARARGEQSVRAAFPNAVIVRPSVLFGPQDAFLANLARLAQLPVIPLFGRGDTRLQPVFVDDVAQAVARLTAAADPAASLFELGGARVYRYREIVEQVLDHCGRRRRLLMPVPFLLWRTLAGLTMFLPNPPLTRDQVLLMQKDNVVHPGTATFADLGIAPHSLEESLPHCLKPGQGRDTP